MDRRLIGFGAPCKRRLQASLRREAFWRPSGVRLWSARASILPASVKTAARSICDAVSHRHEHHQQCRQNGAVRVSARLVPRAVGHRSFYPPLTVGEIRRGVLEQPKGKRRSALEAWFSGPEGPQALFAGRILPFDDSAALLWARLMAEGKAIGRPRSALDMIIASIAGANDCVIVTDNERDFKGLRILNPL